MTQYVALLRGINVGGNNVLPMAELRAIFEGLGFTKIATYIQSGNCIFDSGSDDQKALSVLISDAVFAACGFKVPVIVLRPDELEDALSENPFDDPDLKPGRVHFFFLSGPAVNPDVEAIDRLQLPTEEIFLTDNVFYLNAPDGIGRSKLAAKAQSALRVPVTARNLRTVTMILRLCTKG